MYPCGKTKLSKRNEFDLFVLLFFSLKAVNSFIQQQKNVFFLFCRRRGKSYPYFLVAFNPNHTNCETSCSLLNECKRWRRIQFLLLYCGQPTTARPIYFLSAYPSLLVPIFNLLPKKRQNKSWWPECEKIIFQKIQFFLQKKKSESKIE